LSRIFDAGFRRQLGVNDDWKVVADYSENQELMALRNYDLLVSKQSMIKEYQLVAVEQRQQLDDLLDDEIPW